MLKIKEDLSKIKKDIKQKNKEIYFLQKGLNDIHKDYEVPHDFSSTSERTYNKKKNTYDYKRIETIPLLKACGIANLIDADTMYYAIDEYFSLMKTASETTTAEGTTNKDKIVNHGFDTKTSFRGK